MGRRHAKPRFRPEAGLGVRWNILSWQLRKYAVPHIVERDWRWCRGGVVTVLHDFDLNLLIYLDALICEQSVTKAAALVHITQPSMSLALTRLRNHFRDELLVSIGRNMVLTPLAQSLAAPVRELVLKAQLVSATVGQFEPAVSTRKFTVAASDYAIEILLNTILAGMAQE